MPTKVTGALTENGRLQPNAARAFWIIGLLFVFGGIRSGAPVWWLMLTGERALSQVVDVVQVTDLESPSTRQTTQYRTTVEFDAGDRGRVRVARILLRGRRLGSEPKIGAVVDVAYPRGNPDGAQLLHGRAPWAGGVLALVVGALLIAATFAGRPPTSDL